MTLISHIEAYLANVMPFEAHKSILRKRTVQKIGIILKHLRTLPFYQVRKVCQ